ncbi:MAG: hypothetical protein LLF96_11040 [Eubacteriales bacterium]|nr:hypothetical protein [Eubacteriales bacterium]
MKRALALLVTFCLLFGSAAATGDTGETRTVELTKDGVTVYKVEASGTTDTLQYKVQYPAFECEDATLQSYLTQAVTTPLLALRKMDKMSADAAYENGGKDTVRVSFTVSMDFSGVLSLEASVGNRAADGTLDEVLFFYRIIDLQNRKELSLYDLFSASRDVVDAAVRTAVFQQESVLGTAIVSDASQVPAPNSCFLTTAAFRCLYAAGTVAREAAVVDIPWAQLGLTRSAVLTGGASQADASASAPVNAITDMAALTQLLTATDWKAGNGYLRFLPDGTVVDPTGLPALYTGYAVQEGKLYLDSADLSGQAATVTQTTSGLLFTFDATGGADSTLALFAASVPAQEPEATQTPQPATLAPLSAVVTPTPMPVAGEDADIVAFLTQGLWKPLGDNGNIYYQFTADGKLLTIEVSSYTVAGGTVESDVFSGEVSLGGTAFTLIEPDGSQNGYVLNRSGTAIAPAEFVTPSPTPTPSPSPTPSPAPTPSPTPAPTATPSPTPTPTPTLSPYEVAVQTAPTLAVLSDATFEKRQTLKVYSAPDENSYRSAKAQVTTDDTVDIFGVTGDWVLVSYPIGDGSRGRIGYISTVTLADAANVAKLSLASIDITLTRNATATDDPLMGKGKIFELKKGVQVKLLAFLGTDWAYIETTYKDQPCRIFIPRASLSGV